MQLSDQVQVCLAGDTEHKHYQLLHMVSSRSVGLMDGKIHSLFINTRMVQLPASSLNKPKFWSLHRNALRDKPLSEGMQIMIKS